MMEVELVRLESLGIYEGNPRGSWSEDELAALVRSIDEEGLLYPLLVTRFEDGYKVVDGGRRLRACRILGAEFVPCVVVEGDKRSLDLGAWIANTEREEVSWVDEARWLARMAEEHGCSEAQLGAWIGRSEAYVRARLAFFEWPAVLQAHAEEQRGRLSVLRVLARLGDTEDMRLAVEWDRTVEASYRQAVGYVDAVLARRGEGESGGAASVEGGERVTRVRECGVCGEAVDWRTARVVTVCGDCMRTAEAAFGGGVEA